MRTAGPPRFPFTKVLSLSLPSPDCHLLGLSADKATRAAPVRGSPLSARRWISRSLTISAQSTPDVLVFTSVFQCWQLNPGPCTSLATTLSVSDTPASFSSVLIPPPKDCAAYLQGLLFCLFIWLGFHVFIGKQQTASVGDFKGSSAVPGLGPRSPGSGWAHPACFHHSS